MMPVCVKCQLFFKPKKNGVTVEEGKPCSDPTLYNEDGWSSYKLWRADLLECRGCGTEIVSGFGQRNFAEHYEPDYAALREAFPPYVFVKDCC